jgi:hypothetical protein
MKITFDYDKGSDPGGAGSFIIVIDHSVGE